MKPINNNSIDLHVIYSLIVKVISDNDLLKAITNVSFEHDNGFMKIVLQERNENGFGIRIHKWKEGISDSNIHTHRWNMTSFILQGEYYASQYKKSLIGKNYYQYDFKSYVNDYILTPQKRIILRRSTRQHYQKGDSYTMFKGDIHKISRVGKNGAISIMISWGQSSQVAEVYSVNRNKPIKSSQRRLNINEVNACLNEVSFLLKECLHITSFQKCLVE